MNIDRLELVAMIDYLVDNIFIQVVNNVFRQCVGIPMGTDVHPFLPILLWVQIYTWIVEKQFPYG
jgi:hypothetical protein